MPFRDALRILQALHPHSFTGRDRVRCGVAIVNFELPVASLATDVSRRMTSCNFRSTSYICRRVSSAGYRRWAVRGPFRGS